MALKLFPRRLNPALLIEEDESADMAFRQDVSANVSRRALPPARKSARRAGEGLVVNVACEFY